MLGRMQRAQKGPRNAPTFRRLFVKYRWSLTRLSTSMSGKTWNVTTYCMAHKKALNVSQGLMLMAPNVNRRADL